MLASWAAAGAGTAVGDSDAGACEVGGPLRLVPVPFGALAASGGGLLAAAAVAFKATTAAMPAATAGGGTFGAESDVALDSWEWCRGGSERPDPRACLRRCVGRPPAGLTLCCCWLACPETALAIFPLASCAPALLPGSAAATTAAGVPTGTWGVAPSTAPLANMLRRFTADGCCAWGDCDVAAVGSAGGAGVAPLVGGFRPAPRSPTAWGCAVSRDAARLYTSECFSEDVAPGCC